MSDVGQKMLGLAPDGAPIGYRVWVDGCFDLVHFGHCNLLRQAAKFGKTLVVGAHSDAEIQKHKGPPVSLETERYRLLRSVKWVHLVVEDAPYVIKLETLDSFQCDFVVHGSDVSTGADGQDTSAEVKKANRYREADRTSGVSTTNIVGRILRFAQNHSNGNQLQSSIQSTNHSPSPPSKMSQFAVTTHTLLQFAEGRKPKPSDKVVYVLGTFDLFHVGHLGFLEEARKLGDFLLVGLIDDEAVQNLKCNYPILSLHERVLSVLAFKPVDDVLIGAPFDISKDILEIHNIRVVVNGRRDKKSNEGTPTVDPFCLAKKMGIYHEVDSGSQVTTDTIIDRVIEHREKFEKRNKVKEEKEALAKTFKTI